MDLPASFIVALPKDLLVVALVLLTCSGMGRWLLMHLDANGSLTALERPLLGTMLGYGMLVYLIWVLAWANLLRPGASTCLVVILGVLTLAQITASLWETHQALKRKTWSKPKAFEIACLCAFAFIAVSQIAANHLPALENDDLSYHLYLPKMHLAHAGLSAPDYPQYQSYFSHMLEMGFIPALEMGGQLTAKAYNIFWGLLLSLLAVALAKRIKMPAGGALLAALGVYATPEVMRLGQHAMPDLPVACLILGSICPILARRPNDGRGLAIAGALLLAIAMSKYTAWFYGAAVTMAAVYLADGSSARLKTLALYLSACLLAIAPHALYTWSSQGSPFYPIYLNASLPYDAVQKAIQDHFAASPKNLGAFLTYLLQDWGSGANFTESPLIILAPLILLYPRWRNKGTLVLLVISTLAMVLRFLSLGDPGILSRYLLPGQVIWVILAAYILADTAARGKLRL